MEDDDSDVDVEMQRTADEALEVLDVYIDSPDVIHQVMGGMVGNPDLNSANGTEMIEGIPSKHVFDDCIDYDYKSEYPWAEKTRQISKSTQIGRLIISGKISDRQNSLPRGMEKRDQDRRAYIPGAEFTADYITRDVVSLGNVWFGLDTVMEMNELFRKSRSGGEV